jgi:lipopolysaccharide/colanic/teichoic acid biosynthesis glycosyltransferase
VAIPQAHLTRATFGRYPSTVVELVVIGAGWQFTLKEAADRAVALVALLFLAPLLLAIALGVRVSSIGPVIFRQRRIGRGGEAFMLFKFRTMVKDSGVAGFTLAHGTAPGGIEGTDRRTTVGRWLRATSLDELPQLVNVLRGEMSLIGPRPERPEYVELFAKVVPGYTERLRVKSGITGWAQANGLRGQTSIADRVEFDNYYIENWSLALDLRILALTAVELLRFRDGRSDSLRDRASQHTAVPSACLVVRVELGCAGRGRRLAGAARNNNPASARQCRNSFVRGRRSWCEARHPASRGTRLGRASQREQSPRAPCVSAGASITGGLRPQRAPGASGDDILRTEG